MFIQPLFVCLCGFISIKMNWDFLIYQMPLEVQHVLFIINIIIMSADATFACWQGLFSYSSFNNSDRNLNAGESKFQLLQISLLNYYGEIIFIMRSLCSC